MKEPDALFFPNREVWHNWLVKHHDNTKELWIIYYKKHTGEQSLVYREALEEALCFGWIDGTVKRLDEERYMQRFTPRRLRSNWSEVNIRLALRLLEEGRMQPSGLKFRDQWVPASPQDMKEPSAFTGNEEWESVIHRHEEAERFYRSLAPSYQKLFKNWIFSAKRPETRAKRMAEAIATLAKGEKLGMK